MNFFSRKHTVGDQIYIQTYAAKVASRKVYDLIISREMDQISRPKKQTSSS